MTYRDELQALHAQNEALQQQLKEAKREISRLRALQIVNPTHRGETDGGNHGPGPRPAIRDDNATDRTGARLALMFGLVMVVMTSLIAGRALSERPRFDAWRYEPYHSSLCPHWSEGIRSGAYMAPVMAQLGQSVERSGRVTNVSGATPVPLGTQCDVRVIPAAAAGHNCRVEVQCGDTLIYGKPMSGYTHCAIERGVPTKASDTEPSSIDNDGKLQLDLDAGKMVIADEPPSGDFTVGLSLDPDL